LVPRGGLQRHAWRGESGCLHLRAVWPLRWAARVNLSVRDAANLLRVSERVVYRWIREGSIPFRLVNDHYRFHRSELLEWATSRGLRVAAEEFHEPDASGSVAARLNEALDTGGVHYDVPATDATSLLRAVVARMPIEEADRGTICDFLAAREALGSTGVGEGIAIPHVRNPIVLHVPRPAVTLCFLRQPVEFAAIDGKPVDTVFSVVSPTIRSHLALLSRIAAALHDPGFKQAVLARAPRERLLAEARRVEGALDAAKGAGAP
jgi:PTS system nitrogen regulatory IIA component